MTIDYDRDQLSYALANALKERDEIQEKYDTLAVENMLDVHKLCKERDEARQAWYEMHSSFERSRDEAEKLMRERDEARKEIENEMKWHHQTHQELVEAQCKLLDIEYDKLKS